MHTSAAIGHSIVDEVLARLRNDRQFMRDVSDWQRAPARPARFAGFPVALDPRLRTVLRQRGIEQLYTHQSQAIEAALNREHVVVVASAAGGKSLCFHVPILAALLDDPNARALCLFPTKALGQDQLAHLSSFISDLSCLNEGSKMVNAYDGDTPQARRAEIRRDARVLITNADMLHMGILPHHTRWAMFFRNLRYVVVDEMHAYRGVFGSHVANIIRRLKRLCAFYGSTPTFILASATIANPREHAERLIEAPVALVDDDGSPRGERNVIIVNPPITDPELGLRRSADFVARDIAARFIAEGLQTICFARSRNAAEILLTYLRDATSQAGEEKSSAGNGGTQHAIPDARLLVRGYRGGYLPEERRGIEKGLREGSVRGVVATNALELGIDIGGLDACVMLGYPGSIASFWQQAGRAGRRQSPSVAVMVATPDPLDQYLAAHPEYLFRQSPEHARIAPDNLGVLAAHVTCATFELPFRRGERFGNARVDELLDALADGGEVHVSGVEGMPLFRSAGAVAGDAGMQDAQSASEDRKPKVQYTWVGQGYPADRVSLRGVGDRVSIVNERGEPIGETERSTAPARVHPGAIYLHQAETYLVTELDWELGRAVARRVDADYYTQASAVSEVVVVREFDPPAGAGDRAPAIGEIEVTTTVGRYRQVQFNTHRTLGWGDVDLPAQKLLTIGYWFVIPEAICRQLEKEGILGRPNDYGPNWEQQRQAARARDAYRCVICGKPEGPHQQHHVHHRRPFRTFGYVRGENDHYVQANDLDNLMTVCPACHARIETAEPVNQALSGLCYVLANLAPLFVMCDASDIAAAFDPANAHTRLPTITLYELVPGGTGLAEELMAHHAELLRMATQRVRECPCEHGCPSCIGPMPPMAEPRERNLKRDVIRLIELIA
ncbi:MAG: DEAD/DEAH box helicase [Anaerolineae bacterium]|nr:DEAD/DEAH box helicase [Anaerolineae bacterium]